MASSTAVADARFGVKQVLRAMTATTSLIASCAFAHPLIYGPFDAAENRVLPLPNCETSRQITSRAADDWDGTVEFSRNGARLELTLVVFGIYEARIFDTSKDVIDAVPFAVGINSPGDVDSAVCADLNHDGRADFVFTVSLGGNGLAASFYRRFFVLSAADGYHFWSIVTMDPSPEDFVTFGVAEPVAMLSTAFVQSGDSDYSGPNQRHSYLAYDLWKFRGGDIVSANSIDARFPKYVLMTAKENHKPSIRMSKNPPSVAGESPKLLGVFAWR
jgi:hypothetical protein